MLMRVTAALFLVAPVAGDQEEIARMNRTQVEVCGQVTALSPAPNRCDLTLRLVTGDGQTVAAIVPRAQRPNFPITLHDHFQQRVCVTGVLEASQGELPFIKFPFITVTSPEQFRLRGTPPEPFAAGAVDSCTPGIELPRLVNNLKPNYTGNAMRERAQGVVVVQAVVGVNGSVTRARIVGPVHPELDEECLKTVKKWEFKPGTRDGKPIAVLVDVEMTFTLDHRRDKTPRFRI